MIDQNSQAGSVEFSEIIEQISVKTAEKFTKQQEVAELPKLMAQINALQAEVNTLKSQKSKLPSMDAVEVNNSDSYESDLIAACKSFDDARHLSTKIILNKNKVFNRIKANYITKGVTTNPFINTFNGAQGGYSVAAPTYTGLINTNALVYAPILSLCGKLLDTGLNGAYQLGYDNADINVAYAKEGVEFDQSKIAKLQMIDIKLDAVSGYHPFSKRMMNTVNRGEAVLDFIRHNEEGLQKAIDRKVNNEIMKELKVEAKYKTTFTTATSNALSFNDLFALAGVLKPDYQGNAVFVCNQDTLAYLATIIGSDGQYIWRDIYKPSEGTQLAAVTSPAGTVRLVGVHKLADENFDAFVSGGSNQNKLIGTFADFSKFIKVAYSPMLQYGETIQDANLDVKDMGLFVKTAYVGFERVVDEAGVVVKIKA